MAIYTEQRTEIRGREYIFRSAREEDAERLVTYLKQTTAETPYLLREPEEVTLTVEQEKSFIRTKEAAERELMLLCFDGEKHVGNCSVMAAGGFARQAHRCEVAIALYQKYCGRGIGRKMLETALDRARQMGYEQAELDVVSTNETAVRLYEKLGFKQYGVLPHSMKYRDASYADCVWMMKDLSGERQMIRQIREEDIDKCVQVIQDSFMTVADAFGFTRENAPRFTAFATTRERLQWQYREGRPMYVWEENGQIVGYYSLHLQGEQKCELNNLCVLPGYRHRQIGEKLLEHAFEQARDRGCRQMFIGIVEENVQLRQWYESHGAVHVGTEKFDFFPFTCGYLEKNLAI